MRVLRSALVLAGAAGAAGAAVTIAYAPKDGLLTAAFLAVAGVPVLALAHWLAARRERIGSLSRQFSVGIALTVVLALSGVGAVALLMFVSAHDAFFMAVLLCFAGIVAAYTASLLASAVRGDIETLRAGLAQVRAGDRDITIRTRANDEIAELADAANSMVDALARGEAARDSAESARRDLVAAVSHDLRTPLTSLRLLADAVEDDMVDADERARYLAQMSVHIRSLSALIDDLFELSRLEAGDIQWSMQQVHLEELVEETVAAMRPHAAAKRVAVQTAIPRGLAPAEANPEKLQRVLFNLIQNAIRHTPADGSVTVAATTNGSTVEIEVADTGNGVPEPERESVFEPFFRGGDGAARTGDGAGLGLTICRAIVEAHGGRIWLAEGEPGTRVCFSLRKAAAR